MTTAREQLAADLKIMLDVSGGGRDVDYMATLILAGFAEGRYAASPERDDDMSEPRWRVGRKLGRTLYRDNVCVGMVDSPEVAGEIVAAMNAAAHPGHLQGEARQRDEWHEDIGLTLWWKFPVREPPYSGDPRDDDFPDYVTHWTRIVVPPAPTSAPTVRTTCDCGDLASLCGSAMPPAREHFVECASRRRPSSTPAPTAATADVPGGELPEPGQVYRPRSELGKTVRWRVISVDQNRPYPVEVQRDDPDGEKRVGAFTFEMFSERMELVGGTGRSPGGAGR